MYALFNIVLPVFGLMGVGYAAAWIRLVPFAAIGGLVAYVNNLAIPILVFRTISKGAIPEASPWAYWAAYFLAVGIVWVLGGLFVRHVLGASPLRAGIGGCAGAYSNTMMLGLPLVLTAFGDAGAVPLFLLLSVHMPVMMLAGIAMGEITGRDEHSNVRALALDTLRAVATNPIIIGIVLGLAWRMTGTEMPVPAAKIIDRVADTAVACSLVAMGLTLRRYGIGGDLKLTATIVFFKLVLLPAFVFAFAWLFGLPPVWTGVAVLFAAAPTGVTAYVIATRYDEAIGAVSSSILVGTAVALVTITVVLSLVGVP